MGYVLYVHVSHIQRGACVAGLLHQDQDPSLGSLLLPPFWGSPAQPKFKAGRMVTEHPLAGLRGISIEGLGILDWQFKV